MTQPQSVQLTYATIDVDDQSHVQIARLGKIVVGRIHRLGNRVSWVFWLPGPVAYTAKWHEAQTEDEAKADLLTATSAWLIDAGLV